MVRPAVFYCSKKFQHRPIARAKKDNQIQCWLFFISIVDVRTFYDMLHNMMHGDDTDKQIFFYGHEFYVFSNFSSFAIKWKGKLYMTSEHVYQSEKFEDENLKEQIRNTRSAYDALKLAQANKDKYRSDWNTIKLKVMKEILHVKIEQHPYVKKKLIESGDKELIEDSWRDSYWGWGPNKDGENHLGKLWMEVRNEFVNQTK